MVQAVNLTHVCLLHLPVVFSVYCNEVLRNRALLFRAPIPFRSTPVPLHNDMSGSFFNGCSDFKVTGGGFYNVQGNMYAQSDGTSYTMNGSHNGPSNRNTDRSSFPPNQFETPPNARYGAPNNLHQRPQFQGPRQSAPNLGRSHTQPVQVMNPQGYNTGPRYAIDNVPAPNADTELAARLRRQANLNQMPAAPPIQYAYSVPPLARSEYPRDRRGVPSGPAQPRPRSMVVPQNDSRRMGYSHDDLSSSPEEAELSLRSSRRSSMSQFPRASQDRPPQTVRNVMNINQFTSPANSSYRAGPRGHERRRGPGAARADRGSSSSSDSEDTDTQFSPPPRQSRRTSSQVSSSPPVSLSRPAQPPRRLHRQSGRGDSDSDSDSDDTAIISSGPSKRTGGNSSQHPSTSTWLSQSSSANQLSPSTSTSSRSTYPQASIPSRPTYPQASTSSQPTYPQASTSSRPTHPEASASSRSAPPPPISSNQYPSPPSTSSGTHSHGRSRPDDCSSRTGSKDEAASTAPTRRSNPSTQSYAPEP
ncbi:hypothetical protein B0H12DRAFT_823033 [Mycena haematopus]|nr:hypothetical protein B0H12DRAFT_823033 [Mycena haematopus]